jgi:hypothetical protein
MNRLDKLTISAAPSVAGGALLLLAVFTLLGRLVFRLRPGAALTGGALATALHFVSELWHQRGHAQAAARTGYPMTGVHLWGILGTSLYPPDEPELSGELHVARALGGPRASGKLAAGGGLLALAMWPVGGVAFMVSTLFALENLLVFSFGALFPLPFMETDGTTLLRHRRALRRRSVIVQE